MTMYERFRDRARNVITEAQAMARSFKHDYIAPEHLLLGLAKTKGIAQETLEEFGLSAEKISAEIVARGVGKKAVVGQIQYTPNARKTLELSIREALSFGHSYIDTEHILLGLLRDGDNQTLAILAKAGTDAETLRKATIRAMRDHAMIGNPSQPMLAGAAMRLAQTVEIETTENTLFSGAIVLERRPNDWMAYVEGNRGIWAPGRTRAEAVGELTLVAPQQVYEAIVRCTLDPQK